MADDETGKIMKVTIKTAKEKKAVEVAGDLVVKEFKELVSKKFDAPVEQLCLIFAGKILKDEDTLVSHGIKDGFSVHLVIKSAQRVDQGNTSSQDSKASTNSSSNNTTDTSSSPFGLGNFGGLPGLGSLGMGSPNFMEFQQNMQREMLSNPDLIRQMMDNPFVSQIVSNPETLRQVFMSNPQMQQLMERNPEITHMLNNPDLLRQTMELARNPAMLTELMRSQDRALSNLESIPGGYNALRRMYTDIQEPMLNAAQEQLGSNPFTALLNNSSNTSADAQRGTQNTNPLPNPWSSGGSTGGTRSGSSTTTPTSGNDTKTENPSSTGNSMFSTPGMQSLMQQITQNPQLMQNMLNAPHTREMFSALSSNPDIAQQLIGNNPMFAGNPQLQERMQTMLPTMLQQMQNPETQQMLSNPEALQGILQIQQGLQQLQNSAPGMFSSASGIPGLNNMPPAPAGFTPNTTSTTGSTTSNTTSTPSSTSTTTPAGNQENFSQFVTNMVSAMSLAANNPAPPEERYSSQLDQLATMGFLNRERNLQDGRKMYMSDGHADRKQYTPEHPIVLAPSYRT
ncbi:Ubiquilin-1 [Nymphon striatum]|nr:Ubiquilin-1 [Nymphon striatum]